MKTNSSYVFLTCDVGKNKAVKNELDSFDEVKESHWTYGMYDMVLKVESDSYNSIQNFIRNKINNIKHIRSSLTLALPDDESTIQCKNEAKL